MYAAPALASPLKENANLQPREHHPLTESAIGVLKYACISYGLGTRFESVFKPELISKILKKGDEGIASAQVLFSQAQTVQLSDSLRLEEVVTGTDGPGNLPIRVEGRNALADDWTHFIFTMMEFLQTVGYSDDQITEIFKIQVSVEI